ncbi:hypothetical protein LINPERHAP1_LOCUS26662 [Linum perenne]
MIFLLCKIAKILATIGLYVTYRMHKLEFTNGPL